MMQKSVLYFIMLLIVIGSLFLLYENYFSQSDADRYIFEIQKKYDQDFVGGQTPEETVAGFVEYLRRDDLEGASRYFAPESQTSALSSLKRIKEANVMPQMISDVTAGKIHQMSPEMAILVVANNNKQVLRTIDIGLIQGRWKLLRF